MLDDERRRRFETLVLPHLDAAYNLARWLTRDAHDAEDVVHDAMLRALRYVGALRGDNGRPWLLQIVRHACWAHLRANRPAERLAVDDADELALSMPAPAEDEPPAVALREADRQRLNDAIAALPCAYREVLVLREFEDLSYAAIAAIAEVPVGTVMSRLARARGLLRAALGAAPPSPASRAPTFTVIGGGKP